MTKKSLLKILKIGLSLALCVVAVVTSLGATAIKGTRAYFSSDDFHNEINGIDLKSVTFVMNGEKVTVSDYIHDCAKDYLDKKLPVFFPVADYAIDKVLSNEAIDSAVKEEALECVNYVLNSNRDEAKARMERGANTLDSEALDPKNAKTPTEAVKIYVRAFAFANIEKNTGMSCDRIIVLLSEKTASQLIAIAVVAFLLLIALNYRTVFDVLIYSGLGAFVYGITIKVLQNKFNGAADGNEDLIGFYLLTPFVESFSGNVTWALVIGAVLIALFIAVYFLFKNYVNNEKTPQ